MSDVGFRVVRCAAGTHPVTGKMPMKPKVVLQYDAEDYDPLYGAAHRHSIQRNAVFPAVGVQHRPKVASLFQTPGAVVSSPVVHNGVVYFGCRAGVDGKGGAFIALDAATMEELWRVDVPGGADASACVHKGSVYFGGHDGKLYAVAAGRKGGKIHWAKRTGDEPLNSAPGVAYDVVFTFVGGYGPTSGIRGYHCADGSLAYYVVGHPWQAAAPCVTPEVVLSSTTAATSVAAHRIRDEKPAWASPVPAYGRNDIVVVGGTAYGVLGGGQIGGFYEPGHIASIDLLTGRQNWKRRLEEHIPDTAYCFSSPVVWDGKVFIGMDNGYLHVYDAATGKPLAWRIRIKDEGGNAIPIRTSPSVSGVNGLVYFGASDGILRAMDGKTGEFRWRLELCNGPVNSSVWVEDEALYVGTPSGLVKVVSGS
jgi:outer membrane protein assembly factor BamB